MTENNPQNKPVGYTRVSTYGQTLNSQLAQLKAQGCARIFRETATSARADRPELLQMLKALVRGDVATVTRSDRLAGWLAGSTFDRFLIVKQIMNASPRFRSPEAPWASTSTERLMIAVLGGLADVERDLIRTCTSEGRERAKSSEQHMGRPSKLIRRSSGKHGGGGGGGPKGRPSRHWRKATTRGGRRFHRRRD
jgi:DNA invertase Pin-like site-specific DNA recombinase